MAENFTAEAWSLLAIAVLFIAFRLYFRWSTLGWQKMGWDDPLMVCAGIAYTAETTAAYFVGAYWLGLANNNITEQQRATLDPTSEEWRLRVNGSKTHIIGWFTYTALMWLLKCCWIIYYARLTDGLRRMNIRIKIGWVLIASTYVAAVLTILFKCWPLHRQWQINPNPGNNCQPGFSKLQVSFIMAINTVTDIYLMAIPLPIIYKSRLDLKTKISLMVLFSGGFIVMIFGILRCITLVTVGANEPSESGQWSVRESFVAVLVSNAPMVFPLLKRWFNKACGLSSSGGSKHASYPLDSNLKPSGHNSNGSQRLSRSKKSRNYRHPLSIPNDTAWGSDEAIVTADQEGKNGRVKVKVSNDSLDTVGEEGMLSPQPDATISTAAQAEINGLERKPKDIMMTREWEVTTKNEEKRKPKRNSHLEFGGPR